MLIGSSFPHFKDSNGDPLDAGYIFFGQPNLNPETNPVTVYWDSALTQPASQPIRTLNGYITRDGNIANLYINSNYSITVKNKVSILLYSMADSNKFDAGWAIRVDLANSSNIALGDKLVATKRSFTNAIATTVHDYIEGQIVNVKSDFGAIGDGVTNDTVAIQNAIATGKHVYFPTGNYLVLDALTCSTKGQVFKGAGRDASVIKVPNTFNLGASGVFVCTSGEPGPQWHDLGISFVQPDTSTRASLTNYPPAIFAQWTPRFTIKNCKITNAMIGIDMRGNSGGAFIDLLEISAYTVGIDIDGSLDSIRISNVHYWPFGLTVNQFSIFNDLSNIGLRSGRCDDLHVENCLFINGGQHMNFYTSGAGVGGGTFGSIVNTDFDSSASVLISGANLNIVGCLFTVGNAASQPIKITAGFVRISSCEFECNTPLNNSMVELSGSSYDLYAAIENCIFRISGDTTVISAAQTTYKATLILIGNQIAAPIHGTPTKPLINALSGCRLTMIGNRVSDKGAGSGNLLVVANDEDHIIIGNSFMGWGLSSPVLTSAIIHSNQALASSDFNNNLLTGSFKIKRFTGNLDASGNIVTAHGIAMGHQKVLTAQGFYKGASGEMKQLNFDFIDNSYIGFTGGSNAAAFRATIIYTETQQGW
jgi:hypothetical protein